MVFSGGTLQAGANNINLNANRTLSISGGAVGAIDTQGYNMTVSGPINGSGGFEKTGAGMLTLAAGNTYQGATVINNGTLQLGTLSLSLPNVSSGTLVRWFDATDLNGNGSAVGNGTPVTTWADKGNGQNATSAGGVLPVYVANAINGLPAVQLGSNSYLSFPTTGLASGNSPSTMFAVGMLTAPTQGWDWMVSYGTSNGQQTLRTWPNTQFTTRLHDVLERPLWADAVPQRSRSDGRGLASSLPGGFNFSAYYSLNGSSGTISNGLGLNTTLDTAFIGKQTGPNQEYWAGDVGEVLLYNGEPSAADQQAVENYLDAKWLAGGQTLPTSTDVSVSSGGILDLNGNSQLIASLSGAGTVTNNGAANATLTIGGTTSPAAFTGIISDGPTNATSLVKSGSGTLILAGANNYSGPTTLSGGALVLATPAAANAPKTALTDYVSGGLLFGNGVSAATLGSLGGGGGIALTSSSGQAVALTVGGNNGSTTYSGA